ncbi:heme exporter protein CcmD [Maritimibacter sp. DP07]|uniref:Heme exporter protein D n=1 Tax=Maritimibacter harenae TaxID=2606218 RepID=A0A845MAR8_9RHOB|nr:heme exporter protein CcmD [Maritimibacter harenae]MZR13951.1 heme exporter protein CcmD [Maritimibacter harenae]
MPDLGKYAGAVVTSWAATLVLVAALIAITWWQSARARRKLDAAEARRKER